MRLSKARKEFVTAMMKETIFEAAGSVLEQYGVGGITMERVATTAGLATGSLYNYFQGKDDLLQFVFAGVIEPLFQAIEEAASADAPALKKLERIVRRAVDHGVKHKGLIRLLASSDHDSEARRTIRERLMKIITGVFDAGILEGSIRPHRSVPSARLFLGVLSELMELQVSDVSSEEVNEYVEVLIEAIHVGFSIRLAKDPESGEEP
jgi:TetR/AcrR family transcriptional regulator